jgi:hypothetical protein
MRKRFPLDKNHHVIKIYSPCRSPRGKRGKTVKNRRGPAAVIGDETGSKPLGK